MNRPDTRQIWNANAAAWTELSRAGFDRYRDLVNTPAFFGLLPPVDGLSCLDLGCGEGHNTRLLAGRGARVTALDVAESFIAAAAEVGGHGIRYLVGDGEALRHGMAQRRPCQRPDHRGGHRALRRPADRLRSSRGRRHPDRPVLPHRARPQAVTSRPHSLARRTRRGCLPST